MRQGGWILLDGVEAAPHEVERLMSLLEENPTLSIYESVKPLYFHAKKYNDNTISNSNNDIEIEDVEISPNFQIFITCSEPGLLSPAVRSRCFLSSYWYCI
jgi:hypothetical protein